MRILPEPDSFDYSQYLWLLLLQKRIDYIDEGNAGANCGDNDEQAEGLPRGKQVGPVVLYMENWSERLVCLFTELSVH